MSRRLGKEVVYRITTNCQLGLAHRGHWTNAAGVPTCVNQMEMKEAIGYMRLNELTQRFIHLELGHEGKELGAHDVLIVLDVASGPGEYVVDDVQRCEDDDCVLIIVGRRNGS